MHAARVSTASQAWEALAFAAEGKIRAHIHRTTLDRINPVFTDLKAGKVDGRIVLDING